MSDRQGEASLDSTAEWNQCHRFPSGIAVEDLDFLQALPALHQPEWGSDKHIENVGEEIARSAPLVEWEEVRTLRSLLAQAAAGEVQVLQAGDCAEDPAECTPAYVARKADLLDVLAGIMRLGSGKPVLRVGRIAGQFGKPRSQPTEFVGGMELPVFRGHMVDGPDPDPLSRRPDPDRLLAGFRAAGMAIGTPRARRAAGDPTVWTSHEALLLDYELPMLRRDGQGRTLLTSTHWPWIGERTRQVDGAHVAMLAMVDNPVACKIGPTTGVSDVLALCEALDPRSEPGRLTLISRMGADAVGTVLPPLVEAVAAAGHPVLWLCDPMHGNTVLAPNLLKTRLVRTVVREVREFQDAVRRGGGVAGGLHLETTPDQVIECASDRNRLHEVGAVYTSSCDPRLNPEQAITVASAWHG